MHETPGHSSETQVMYEAPGHSVEPMGHLEKAQGLVVEAWVSFDLGRPKV